MEQGRLFPCPENCGSPMQGFEKTLWKREEKSPLRTLSDTTEKRKATRYQLKDSVFLFFSMYFCVVFLCECCSHTFQKQMDG